MKKVVIYLPIFMFLVSLVSAVPASWYGYVTINGSLAPDGAVVDAYIDNSIVATTTVGAVQSNGYYLIHVEGNVGDNVSFKVYGNNVSEAAQTWAAGFQHPAFNLTTNYTANGQACTYCGACAGGWCCSGATIINGSGSGTCQASVCSAYTPPPGDGGNGGGGSGGGTAGVTCTEQWECTAYGPCSDGKQTRTCTDRNNCGTTENKPAIERACVVREEEEEEEPEEEEEAQPPTESGSYVGQVQVNDNVNWAWTGTEWVKEGTAKYEEIVVKAPVFGKLETIWLYIFIGVVAVAIIIVVVEIMRKRHRF
jgi:hypothetical protein